MNCIPIYTTNHRGRGNFDHPLHEPRESTLDEELCIRRHMDKIERNSQHTAIKIIQLELLDEENLHSYVSEFTLRRWMHELSYEWKDKKFVGGLKPEHRDIRIRQFIYSYAAALKKQKEGTHKIVYMDESCIHQTHQMNQNWHQVGKPAAAGDNNTGARLIIIHAMTDERLLTHKKEDIGTKHLHEMQTTAAFVHEAASYNDDYHKNVGGDTFTLWVKNRLVPTFQALYPDKKMILVMDNASYHRPRDSDWVAPNQMKYEECLDYLQKNNVNEFSIGEGDDKKTFLSPYKREAGIKKKKGDPILPTTPQLKEAVKQHLKTNSHINKTRIDKIFEPLGYTIVWTPPFTPEFQPIELAWAQIKGEVAKKYEHRRTIQQTMKQTNDAFNIMTTEQLKNIVNHSHGKINEFMKSNGGGMLKNYDSLDDLVDKLDDNSTQTLKTDTNTQEDMESE